MRMVVATDGSAHAEQVVQWVRRWATGLTGAEVTVINVGQVPHEPAEFRVLAARLEQHGADILAHAARVLAPVPGKVTTVYRSGDPAEEILKIAREIQADVIVLGRRGLGRIGGFVLGSVSERVLHGAHCAVLIAQDIPVASRAHASGGV